jgi:hydrogenase nickel incorporation protein HypA/HybF
MHESSLGRDVLRAVLERAAEVGASRVRVVRGCISETEWLDPEAIAFHFAAFARGTAAEGARLELATRWVEADCMGCGKRYKPDHHVQLCPHCGSTDAELLGETGLRIDTIEVD